MRLNQTEHQIISTIIQKIFGDNALLYLFGSRIEDDKLGGDIDLLIETNLKPEEAFIRKIQAITEIQFALGEQKIDILITNPKKDDKRLVIQQARLTAVPL